MSIWLSKLSRRPLAQTQAGYLDFALEISPPVGQGKRYLVSVTSSPTGSGRGAFQNPFDAEDLWPDLSARQIGERLFSALFQDRTIRHLYDLSVGIARGSGQGLRLRLAFDMADPARLPRMMRVASLPWELLYDGRFLAMDEQFSIIRQLPAVHSSAAEGPAAFPGSILLAWAAPKDQPSLDLGKECRRIARACRGSGLETVILKHATAARVTQKLRSKAFTIFHFMGHGELGDDGALVFEDEEGTSDPVSGEGLADLVQGARGLRLAVLNACYSGDVPRDEPRAGVAPMLIQRGFPAVLGIRSEIHDQAAVLFSERFYASLATGAPLEKAALEGRLAVLADSHVRGDWPLPVLYQQAAPGPPTMIDVDTTGLRSTSRPIPPVLIALIAALLAAAVLKGALLLLRDPDPPPRPSTVAIACPESGLVQRFDEVRGIGRDPARSYYLFIRDPIGTCWLQGPVPLPLDHTGTWSTRVRFSGQPGDPFTILAVSSRRPLHPEPLSAPGRYDCPVIPPDTDREACSVELAPPEK